MALGRVCPVLSNRDAGGGGGIVCTAGPSVQDSGAGTSWAFESTHTRLLNRLDKQDRRNRQGGWAVHGGREGAGGRERAGGREGAGASFLSLSKSFSSGGGGGKHSTAWLLGPHTHR